ncbi:MAG: multiubiquitin domain-containing protein [Odoribacter sp.]|nr:multiubiquitin domain-containing protein [Odoribacter sp.]
MEKKLKLSIDNTFIEVSEQFLTGLQLKGLANVPLDYDLFLVVPGFDDELIANDLTVNLARPGIERFVSRPHGGGITIFVNGAPCSHARPATAITYEQVVKYAFPNAVFNPNQGYTVSYCDGPSKNPEGILVMGASVFTKNHMRFDVTATHKS